MKTSTRYLFGALLCMICIFLIPRTSLQLLSNPEKFLAPPRFQLSQDRWLILSRASNKFLVPLGRLDGSFTTLHINEWADGPTRLDFYLQDETAKQKLILTHRPINRHRDFNLTRLLKSGHFYSLVLTTDGTDTGNIYVNELVVRSVPGVPYFPPLGLILAGAFLTVLTFSRLIGGRPLPPVSNGEILSALVLLAFAFRWHALGAAVGQPLEGDAGDYHGLALSLSWASPFQNGTREPLCIWVQKIWMSIFGTDNLKFRMMTLILSVSSIIPFYFLCLAMAKKRLVAITASLLVALGDYAIYDAVRGERSQLFTLLILIFCVALIKISPRSWKQEVLLGGLGGLIGWTWLVGVLGVILAYCCRWIHWKIPFFRSLGFWSMLIFLTGGFLFQQWKYRGDPLQSLNVHANFYKNAKETGVPSYGGEKSSWFTYLLGHEGVAKVLKDSIIGTAELFLNPTNPFNKIFLGFHYSGSYSYALFPFLIIGLTVSLYRKEYWSWLLMLSFLNISASLLSEVRDPRLFYHLLPFFAYFFAVGLGTIFDFLPRKQPPQRRPSS